MPNFLSVERGSGGLVCSVSTSQLPPPAPSETQMEGTSQPASHLLLLFPLLKTGADFTANLFLS